MSYLVLARKWRPQTFSDLVGQGHVSRTLENAIAQGRVAHAFLFTGVRGVGKTTSARILAKALNCERGPTASPCLACPPCVDIAAGADVDVQEIDGASYNGVDEVRRLQESLPYRPQRDRFKIFIVDEVHMLSSSAWNAFLKTLEEPPPHVKFIFATTEVHKVPVTILSRCQRYDFKMIAARTIAERLRYVLGQEKIEADDAAVGLIAREAAGSMRDAMSLLDQAIAWGGERLAGDEVARVLGVASRSVVHRLVEAVVGGRSSECLALVGQMVEQGYDLAHLSRDILAHLRDVAVAKVCPEPGALLDLSEDERAEVAALAARADADDLVRLHQGFSRSYDEIVRSVHPRAALEMALVRLSRRPPLVPLDELFSRLGELERRLGGGGGPGGRPGARPGPGGPAAGRPGVGLARPGPSSHEAFGGAVPGGPFGGGTPGAGASMAGVSSQGAPLAGVPSHGAPLAGVPGNGASGHGGPSNGASIHGVPGNGASIHGGPIAGASGNGASVVVGAAFGRGSEGGAVARGAVALATSVAEPAFRPAPGVVSEPALKPAGGEAALSARPAAVAPPAARGAMPFGQAEGATAFARPPAPPPRRPSPPPPVAPAPEAAPAGPLPAPARPPAAGPGRAAGPARNGARGAPMRPGHDAGQPLPPPPPGVDMGRWRRIVEGIRAERPSLASVFDGVVPLQLSPEQAVLAFPPDGFLSSQASEPPSVELLTQRVRAELGPSCAVSFELSPEATTGLTVGRLRAREAYERRRAAERVVEEHPLVRAAVELLGAELRGVVVPDEGGEGGRG
ncbi:MAG TPA: DNA polymerase III subunit gamma/tau [Polyangiaceae bacterium]|nr:DNA polymerase III subunit gamma/tau [Polyangiaceae bacterium]